MSDAPERIWAKGERGFEGYAGTWLDESDGPDMKPYIRLDAHEAAIASARAQALEEAAAVAEKRHRIVQHRDDDLGVVHTGHSLADPRKITAAIRALSDRPDTTAAVIEAAKAFESVVVETAAEADQDAARAANLGRAQHAFTDLRAALAAHEARHEN